MLINENTVLLDREAAAAIDRQQLMEIRIWNSLFCYSAEAAKSGPDEILYTPWPNDLIHDKLVPKGSVPGSFVQPDILVKKEETAESVSFYIKGRYSGWLKPGLGLWLVLFAIIEIFLITQGGIGAIIRAPGLYLMPVMFGGISALIDYMLAKSKRSSTEKDFAEAYAKALDEIVQAALAKQTEADQKI